MIFPASWKPRVRKCRVTPSIDTVSDHRPLRMRVLLGSDCERKTPVSKSAWGPDVDLASYHSSLDQLLQEQLANA
eukprot:4204704-Pyramimonas_sp.AAC.1